MNITNFNKEISDYDLLGVVSNQNNNIDIRNLPKEVLTSPLFIWKDFEDDKLMSVPDSEDVISMIQNNTKSLPFPMIRLFGEPNEIDKKKGVISGFKVWMHHTGNSLSIRMTIIQKSGFVFPMICLEVPPSGIAMKVSYNQRGKNLTPSSAFAEQAKTITQALWTSIAWFIRELNSPANFLASVKPNKQGKSVEWEKSRTHYVIVHKAHPANNKSVTNGASVSRTEGLLKRQAHSRRAHARILRSPRFKNNVGKVIHIKSCWVGPQEWKEGHSIYKVI